MAFETLAVRSASALLLAPLFLYITWLGGLPLVSLLAVASLVGLWEFDRMARVAGHRPDLPIACVGTVAIFAGAYMYGFDAAATAMTLFPTLLLMRYLPGGVAAAAIVESGLTLFAVTHFAYFTSFIYLLRADEGRQWPALVCLLILVWVQDSAAYLAGSAFGRTSLTNISPKKTWEGTLAGFVAALACAALMMKYGFGRPVGILSLAMLSVVGVLAQLGDLSESLLKRNFDAKDSGTLIPGHGGVLDRLDSLCYSAPAMYVLYPWM